MSEGDTNRPSRKRSRPDEWEDVTPSPVIHVRGIPRHTLEIDLVNAFEAYGTIRDVTMMPQKSQALIEFEDVGAAEKVINAGDAITVARQKVQISYSTSKRIVQRAANRVPANEQDSLSADNHILLFTVYYIDHPITVDVVHRIASRYGHVVRIVIFRKAQVQAMVEFKSVKEARTAKLYLNGADIYPGSCTLKVDYARPNRLTVTRNDHDNWDSEICEQVPAYSDYDYSYQESGSMMGMYDGYHEYGPTCEFPEHPNYMPPYQYGYDCPPMDPYCMHRDNGYSSRGPAGAPTCVVMLYNLNMERMNCDRIFNLLCLYGNVIRIKFLRTKEGSAMVEMSSPETASRVISNLSGIPLMGEQLVIRTSKQDVIVDVPHPFQLPDGSPSFKDYTNNRNNRYSTPMMAKKNRIYPPSRILHYWNAPPDLQAETLKEFIKECGAAEPQKIITFPKTSEKSSSGSIEWASDTEAFEALVICNHQSVKDPERSFPFILKLAFANPNREFANGPGETKFNDS